MGCLTGLALIIKPKPFLKTIGTVYWHLARFNAIGKTEETKKFFYTENKILLKILGMVMFFAVEFHVYGQRKIVQMDIYVLGDIHAEFRKLNSFLNKKQPDLILQCGDFGYWPKFDGTYELGDHKYNSAGEITRKR